MTRTERRAAAHATRKAERKAGFSQPQNPVTSSDSLPTSEPEKTISDAQLAANRLNAQKSTGPASSEAKAKVARNAITHNLTGNQILLSVQDGERYSTLIMEYEAEFQPVGPEEVYLLQSIIDTRWRLASIPAYEAALVDLCRNEMIRQAPELANNPAPVLDMQLRSHFEKKFRNLHLQESRLARRREREMKELRALQATRTAEAKSREPQAGEAQASEAEPKKTAPAQNGVAFTTSEIGSFVASLTPEMRQNLLDAILMSDLPGLETLEAAA